MIHNLTKESCGITVLIEETCDNVEGRIYRKDITTTKGFEIENTSVLNKSKTGEQHSPELLARRERFDRCSKAIRPSKWNSVTII